MLVYVTIGHLKVTGLTWYPLCQFITWKNVQLADRLTFFRKYKFCPFALFWVFFLFLSFDFFLSLSPSFSFLELICFSLFSLFSFFFCFFFIGLFSKPSSFTSPSSDGLSECLGDEKSIPCSSFSLGALFSFFTRGFRFFNLASNGRENDDNTTHQVPQKHGLTARWSETVAAI